MQRMSQQMDLCVPPRHELAVEPDKAVAIVIGDEVCHGEVFLDAFLKIVAARTPQLGIHL
jgi:hypothetical protein